ncbi:MAG: hypothetical protein H6707_14300 [Deltaproteobacteria bacterium]|nr:hypothetical protein [Deltaproteobacteria bacterium]
MLRAIVAVFSFSLLLAGCHHHHVHQHYFHGKPGMHGKHGKCGGGFHGQGCKRGFGCKGGQGPASQPTAQPQAFFDAPPAVGSKAMCPVSKEIFTVAADSQRATTPEGKHVVFCCPGCKKKFEKDPSAFSAQ